MPIPSENTQTDRERLARIETLLKSQADDILELRAYLTQVIAELKTRNEKHQEWIGQREVMTATYIARFEQSVVDIKDLKEWRKEVEKLLPALKVVIWIGGVLGVSVLVLIWAILTGQAQIMFP